MVLRLSVYASIIGIGLLTSAPVTNAHLPELYGRQYYRVDLPPDWVEPPEARRRKKIPPSEDFSQHKAQLSEVETLGGPFAEGLTDPLIGLALYHRERGEPADALAAYRRALHLVRINDGLNNERQVPILRAMMTLYLAEGDYSSLGDIYHYYYRVKELGTPPDSDEQLSDRLEYLTLERQLYGIRSDGGQRKHLLQAYRAGERMLVGMEVESEQEVTNYIELVRSQLRNLYLILGDQPLGGSTGAFNSGLSASQQYVNRELQSVQDHAYRNGKKLLEQAIDMATALPPKVVAALHLELGDWFQWNGKLQSASAQYAAVEEILLAAGQAQLKFQWLGQPVELPDEDRLWSITDEDTRGGRTIVSAKYGVSAKGEVRVVQAQAQAESESWQASRISRMLRDTHFRPRFVDGRPEAVERVNRQYMLVNVR